MHQFLCGVAGSLPFPWQNSPVVQLADDWSPRWPQQSMYFTVSQLVVGFPPLSRTLQQEAQNCPLMVQLGHSSAPGPVSQRQLHLLHRRPQMPHNSHLWHPVPQVPWASASVTTMRSRGRSGTSDTPSRPKANLPTRAIMLRRETRWARPLRTRVVAASKLLSFNSPRLICPLSPCETSHDATRSPRRRRPALAYSPADAPGATCKGCPCGAFSHA